MELSAGIVIALIGLGGALIGSLSTLAGQCLTHHLRQSFEKKRDAPRRTLLKSMLQANPNAWRKLDTLAHVIGADHETTKRLLLDIGARASEDGKDIWALISNKPLPPSDNESTS